MKFYLNEEELRIPVQSLVMALKTPAADFQVVYGLGPSGYDDVAWREIGGGGVVDTLFTIVHDQLFIGVLQQMRPYQADMPTMNSIRGYLDPEKTRMGSAVAEAGEEAGIDLVAFELPGDPANPNNASVESWGGGITHYGMYVPPQYLIPGAGRYEFKQGLLKTTNPIGDKILKCVFLPWQEAARLGCQMTATGILRLLVHLEKIQTVSISFGEY
jgi:hypothetical protein